MAEISQRARYEKWIFEGLKIIGAACIAAILALQLGITRQEEKILKFSEDIDEIRTALREINNRDAEFVRQLSDNRILAAGERREIERAIEHVKDMLRQHELEVTKAELDKYRNGTNGKKR